MSARGKFVVQPYTLIPGAGEGFYVAITTSNTAAYMNKDGFAVENVKSAQCFATAREAYDSAIEHGYEEDRGYKTK